MAEVNWEEVKTEYVTTDTSHRKLANKYGLSLTTISHRSKVECWVEKRQQFRSKVEAKTLEKSANAEANRLAKLMDTTGRAIDVAVKALADEQQFNRYLVNRKEAYASPVIADDGETALSEKAWTEEIFSQKIDTKALKELTAALKDLTGLMRDFYNIPTPAQAEAQRIAAERLELDRLKASVDNGPPEPVTVIMGGDADEYAD